MTGSARIIRGNALALPLADASVDLVVTSPPYFGLRSYQDDGAHYAGQIGSEPTPTEFVDALIAATREMMRVLKPSGSIWVNLGDKYAGSGGEANSSVRMAEFTSTRQHIGTRKLGARAAGVPTKSLMGIPWRYALRCIDELGLILRAEVIWAKPNGLPESVTDRVRRSHEQWFHFTREPRYFSAVDEIRETTQERPGRTWDQRKAAGVTWTPGHGTRGTHLGKETASDSNGFVGNPLGKLPGSVWEIATQPLTVPPELGVDHFAAFPMEFPRRIIRGWSPAGVCTACGEGRRPVAEKGEYRWVAGAYKAAATTSTYGTGRHGMGASTLGRERDSTIIGYACACPDPSAPTTPSVVLDSFGGTGTTALMAKALGRIGISVDMSGDYSRLAQWRTTDPGQLAAALQVEKPEPVSPDQLDLFGEVVA